MELALTPEQTLIQDTARKYAQDSLAPVASALDAASDKEAARAIFLNHLRQLAELGFMGLNVDSVYGGFNPFPRAILRPPMPMA